ncbi:hypothetical protein KZC45_23000 [Salmonella enterica subsp. enterica serovar Javiana]|uniref:hypothetical protein n=1 Tax=Salmonella enterica TaxID=28901 RepID=UPI001C5BBBAA|nr:hypothetical protein [Salmonella enterica]MBW3174094.1 hypothetical protein [Salmonella enterica subsp. enterica serovar Javiana]
MDPHQIEQIARSVMASLGQDLPQPVAPPTQTVSNPPCAAPTVTSSGPPHLVPSEA